MGKGSTSIIGFNFAILTTPFGYEIKCVLIAPDATEFENEKEKEN